MPSGSFAPYLDDKSETRNVSSDKGDEGNKTLQIQVLNVKSSTDQGSVEEDQTKDASKVEQINPETFKSTSDNSKQKLSNDSKEMLQKKDDNGTDDNESKLQNFENTEKNRDPVTEKNLTGKQDPTMKHDGKKPMEKKPEYDYSNVSTCIFIDIYIHCLFQIDI